jgi:peptide/nickel transport system permease protein
VPDNTARNLLIALGILAAISFMLPWLAGNDPLQVDLSVRLTPPGTMHWLGTDDLGRDLYSRIMHGAALTVTVSVAALVSSIFLGATLGAIGGYYYGRWPDRILVWAIDFLTAIPFLLVIAAILSVIGPSLGRAYLVLIAIMWTNTARIVRAEVIRTMPLDYITAERALGVAEWRVLFITALPGCLNTAFVFSVSYLPEIIALEAGLSFLGLGVQPPRPGLGKMIFDGVNYLGSAWWMALFPALALFLIVLGVQAMAAYGRRRWKVDRVDMQTGVHND